VRDGLADAWVTVGHTGAAVAAAALTLGRVPGMTRPALAVVLPATHGPVVLVDAGAVLDATADTLLHFALAGWCYAHALDIADPVIGLLSIGSEPGKGDVLRSVTDSLLRQILPGFGMRYAGPVEGHDVSRGERAQVIVTDGFTGNVLLKGIEGAVTWTAARLGESYGDHAPARRLVTQTATGDFAGGMLLGVNGVTVIGHGAGSPAEIAACIRLAARVAEHDIVAETQSTFSALVSTP
jgi:glycerol-3-phosphate acyltransferase PlsX